MTIQIETKVPPEIQRLLNSTMVDPNPPVNEHPVTKCPAPYRIVSSLPGERFKDAYLSSRVKNIGEKLSRALAQIPHRYTAILDRYGRELTKEWPLTQANDWSYDHDHRRRIKTLADNVFDQLGIVPTYREMTCIWHDYVRSQKPALDDVEYFQYTIERDPDLPAKVFDAFLRFYSRRLMQDIALDEANSRFDRSKAREMLEVQELTQHSRREGGVIAGFNFAVTDTPEGHFLRWLEFAKTFYWHAITRFASSEEDILNPKMLPEADLYLREELASLTEEFKIVAYRVLQDLTGSLDPIEIYAA